MNRKSHQTDITLKLYRDGYRLTCQCGNLNESVDLNSVNNVGGALDRIFDHLKECERIKGKTLPK